MLHGGWRRAWWIVPCTTVLLAAPGSIAQPAQYSAADEIRVNDVGHLTLRRTIAIGQHGGYAGAPVVDGDRLFVVTPFPHTVLAIDLAGTDPAELWRYSPSPEGAASGLASTDVTTGGIALSF